MNVPTDKGKKPWQGMKWCNPVTRVSIYMRDHGECIYCRTTERLTLDHLLPVTRGGDNGARNLVTACLSCNMSKGKKPWRAYAARYTGAIGRIQRQRRRSVKQFRVRARTALKQTNNVLTALKSA